eukprot:PITA_04800
MALLQKMCRGVVGTKIRDLPGFRFYPTEEELLDFYLNKRVQGPYPLSFHKIIPTLDLYRYDPWELPGLDYDAGLTQWFFFVPRNKEKVCPQTNRLTASGFWKATSLDRAIHNKLLHCIGLKKTLLFYKGKGPRGEKTNCIMNEYESRGSTATVEECLVSFTAEILMELIWHVQKKMDMVLCRIYRKAVSHKSIEEGAKSDHLEKEERAHSVGDEYPEKSHSDTLNGSCQLSNPTTETTISSLPHKNENGMCSSSVSETNNESNLFDFLEPFMFYEDTMVFMTPKARKRPPQLELPKLLIDCLFTQSIATPFSLLSTPSPFQVPSV